MTRPVPRKPTDSELAILQSLWDQGPSTVRQVFSRLSEDRETGYTTVLKLMQIMMEKGLLVKDGSVRPQVYSTAFPQNQTQRQLLTDLANRAFSGSPGDLVLQALSTQRATQQELRQIRELLDQLEGEDQ